MFKRITFYLKNLRRLQAENIAYNRLNQFGNFKGYVPYSEYASSPIFILHILNEIVLNKRAKIIEFGSGISTIYIARMLSVLNNDIEFISVDDNMNWINILKEQLHIDNLDYYVKFINAPLINNGKYIWYDNELLNNSLIKNYNYDLVIIDGPFGETEHFIREHAVDFLKNKLMENYIIFLDDTNRPDEKESISSWVKILKNTNINCYSRYTTIYSQGNFNSVPSI